ncbi:hypothetical protein [Paracoccus lutimaris]|uniref:Cytochrome c domain-containing protein n=1 Tax=Paracoccus lutimaris TaxID=1490030 RepID=A0A368Z267_9RHOB|nr:hypothetical protein [Paracoccus lutimaris]RCW85878.1 hypothetical protein DFP89_105145 [Paracoccus lutimaris]
MRGLIPALLLAALPVAADEGPGAALYLRGTGAEARLMGGKLRVPATRFPCAGCHGQDARGSREGATIFPAIDWPGLTAPDRPGGAYDRAGFLHAVTDGVAPDGRELDPAMPRYVADEAVLGALIAFLQGIGAAQQRGITPGALRVSAAPGTPAQVGLEAAAKAFNARGGAFGRRIEIVTQGDMAFDADELAELLEPRLAQLDMPEIADLPAESRRAYLHGLMLGEALIACGRRLTRACLETTLPKLDPARLPREGMPP